jgi:hypothetical protein
MELANTLAYYDMATITAIKGFIAQAPGAVSGWIQTLELEFLSQLVYLCTTTIVHKLHNFFSIFFSAHLSPQRP